MEEVARRWNTTVFWALLLSIAALAVNFAPFLNLPLHSMLPWLSLLLALAALVALAVALRRAIVYSQTYRGKAWSIVLAVLTLVIAGANLLLFFHTRDLPASTAAPQVGQRLPDFALADTNGQSASLDSLLASFGDSSSAAPRAVLLIFYRGYW